MKHLLVFLFFILQFVEASAACRSVFTFGFHGAIMIQSPAGASDGDADALWIMMNVPEQDSMLGPGKSIVSAGKELNFICINRGGDGTQMSCNITLNARGKQASRWIQLDSRQKKMHFKVTGAEAKFFTEKIHLPENSETGLQFQSSDQKFRILVRPEHFEIFYDENGLTRR